MDKDEEIYLKFFIHLNEHLGNRLIPLIFCDVFSLVRLFYLYKNDNILISRLKILLK